MSSTRIDLRPLHEQVHDVLRNRILAGEWEPREPLPGEASLSRELGVSVGTVRKAMDRLIRENIVVRQRGKGTFVRRGTEWRSNSAFRLHDSAHNPIQAEIAVVDCQTAIAPVHEARLLKPHVRSLGRPRVLRLVREWRRSGSLVCRETLFVEAQRFPGLANVRGLNAESLFAIYDTTYRVKIESVRWQIGAVGSGAGAASELEEPTIRINRLAFDARGEPVEVCEQLVSLANCSVEVVR